MNTTTRSRVHIGEQFHAWTIIEPNLHMDPTKAERQRHSPGAPAALVECSCLHRPRRLVKVSSLLSGKSKNCGQCI